MTRLISGCRLYRPWKIAWMMSGLFSCSVSESYDNVPPLASLEVGE
jgi:hypothetical protein